jgi:DNA-binding SARP family transcriptional activator/streptogramin lyase
LQRRCQRRNAAGCAVAIRETARDNAGEVEFRVLGPLEVSAAGRPLPLGGRKQRAVLALLLLDANRLVPRDRLISEVWGPEPPAQVEASLRVYVARLRKLLAAENSSRSILETRPNGYVLRVEPGTLDLDRFRQLVASGEAALAGGRPADAADALADALALWRGPALVDLGEDEWARRESALLDDLRLRALEERITADLALGRRDELVAELEGLVAAHPYRERLTGQLMVALYQAGRQTDALDVYATARDTLREEFGLEPTRELRDVQRRILVQDPELDAAAPVTEPAAPVPRRRLLGVSFAATVLVAAVAGAWLLAGSDQRAASSPPVLRGNSVVAIDPTTASILGEVRIGGRPSGIAVGARSVWVGNRDDRTLVRIDPRRRTVVRTIGLGHVPGSITVGGGSVWVASESGAAVLEVDPDTNAVVATIPLLETGAICCPRQLAFARGSLWVSYHGPRLTRIDSGRRRAVITPFRDVVAIGSSMHSLWAVRGFKSEVIQRLEPLGDPIRIDALGPISPSRLGTAGLAVGDRAAWVASQDGAIVRIDTDTSRVTASVSLDRPLHALALAQQGVWLLDREGRIHRVSPTSGRVLKTISLGVYAPYQVDTLAVGEGAVWVTALER